MKKTAMLILSIMMIVAFASCGSADQTAEQDQGQEQAATESEENADALAGKTLIPFSTHAGSGLSGFDSKLESACPESTVGEGLAIAGKDAQKDQENVRSEVNEWLEGLGY